MKSTIKIEFNFDTKEPYIQANIRPSEDLRDQMMANFFEALAGKSNILTARQETLESIPSGESTRCYIIQPVKGNHPLINQSTNTELFPCIDLNNNMFENQFSKVEPKIIDGTPRRNKVDKNYGPELAIRAAMEQVEGMGADPMLTDAVLLLEKAFNKVADYIDTNEENYKLRMSSFTPAR